MYKRQVLAFVIFPIVPAISRPCSTTIFRKMGRRCSTTRPEQLPIVREHGCRSLADCWLQKGRCRPRLSPQQSHARCGALASISSTRIKYYHKKQVQIFITQRLYDSQQRLLKNYFFPGRVERRVGFGFEECIPSVPAFPFFTEE